MIYTPTKTVPAFGFYSDRGYPSYASAQPPFQEGNITAEGMSQKVIDETHLGLSSGVPYNTDEHQTLSDFVRGYIKERPESWTGADAELAAMLATYEAEQAALFALYCGSDISAAPLPVNSSLPLDARVTSLEQRMAK